MEILHRIPERRGQPRNSLPGRHFRDANYPTRKGSGFIQSRRSGSGGVLDFTPAPSRAETSNALSTIAARRLELLEGKLSRAVLRGGRHGNVPSLTRQKGKFQLPSATAAGLEIDATTFSMLLNGLDLAKMKQQKRYTKTG